MAHTLQHKGFEPAAHVEHATQPRTAGKRWLAISWALRPCGVSIFEAQTRLAERGGAPYSYSYTRSAQYSKSEYAPLGYGLVGKAETVADHLQAVEAVEGADAAQYVRACLPASLSDDDQLLVVYAYAAGGIAYGPAGQHVDGLAASADDVAQRREALTAKPGTAKPAAKRQTRSKGGSAAK